MKLTDFYFEICLIASHFKARKLFDIGDYQYWCWINSMLENHSNTELTECFTIDNTIEKKKIGKYTENIFTSYADFIRFYWFYWEKKWKPLGLFEINTIIFFCSLFSEYYKYYYELQNILLQTIEISLLNYIFLKQVLLSLTMRLLFKLLFSSFVFCLTK